MTKRKALAASEVVYVMGLMPPAKTPDGRDIRYGRQAVVGQYTKPYARQGHTPPGRVSKGARARFERDEGSQGMLDLSAVINAKR